MLKIRLMRIGAKQRPFYRVVAVDERSKRNGAYIELLGTYNPLTEPKEIKLNQDRIDHWVKQGAQLSYGFLRIIGKAPQRAPRKPKKEKKEEVSAQPVAEAPKAEEVAPEQPKTEEKAVGENAQTNTSLGIPTSDGGSVSEAKTDSSEVNATETPATEETPVEEATAPTEQPTETPITETGENKEIVDDSAAAPESTES